MVPVVVRDHEIVNFRHTCEIGRFSDAVGVAAVETVKPSGGGGGAGTISCPTAP